MRKAIVVLLFSMVLGIGTAHAAITVDGLVSPGTEWNTWFIHATDPNEPDIADNYDIKEMFAWWDSTTVYIRTDVYGTPTLAKQDPGSFFPAFYQWSVDTDNDSNGELTLLYDLSGVSLYDITGASPVLLGAGTGAFNNIVEVSFAKSLVPVALQPASDFDVSMFARLDNAGADPDDRLPDTGWSRTVPEPSSMFLLGLGLIGFTGSAFRKRFKA